MANASPSRLLALGVVCSIERKEGRFNTNSALRGLVAAGAGGEGVGGGAVQTCSHNPFCTPPSAHCVPIPPWRTLHAPSGGSSTTLATRLPPSSPSQRHIHGCVCAHAAAPGAPCHHHHHRPDCGLPPPLDSPPPAPPACSCAIHMAAFPLRYD